jgi:hypothetical protein
MGFDRVFAGTLFPCNVSLSRFFIKRFGLPLDDGYGACRAFAETGGKSVAILVGNEPCFSAFKLDGPFGAGADALPASVAFLFIYVDDLSFGWHRSSLKRVTGNRQWVMYIPF